MHRADITALKGSLKPKVEFVLTVPLTPQQNMVYRRYVDAVLGSANSEKASQVTIFSWLAILTLLCNHPRAFRTKLLEPVPVKSTQKIKAVAQGRPDQVGGIDTPIVLEPSPGVDGNAEGAAPGDQHVFSLGFTEQQVQQILEGLDDDLNPMLSVKVGLFVQLLSHSRDCGDKMLVFSQSIPTLQYLDDLLTSYKVGFGRIDGSVPIAKRGQIIEDFQHNFDVLLVSTRAGGVGLNIQCANRVVIFDFGFNPAWEEQAIGRAYRLGQEKPVWVYRFVVGGTFERNLYNKNLFKTSLTSRVVDKKNPIRNAERNTKDYLYYPEEVLQTTVGQFAEKDPQVLGRIIEEQATEAGGIREIVPMETLQVDARDDPLNAEEEREVQQEILDSKARKGVRKTISQAGPASLPHQPVISSSAAAGWRAQEVIDAAFAAAAT